MNRKRILISALIIPLMLLSACATTGPKEEAGLVIGGIIGGVLGSQVGSGRGRDVATAVGAIIGSSVGGSIGRSMDELDRMKMSATLETTRTGVSTTWTNPDTGYDYRVTPTRTYEVAEGPCREYTLDAEIGGRTEEIYGTACRQPDGSWRIVD
jgi:surface antigen